MAAPRVCIFGELALVQEYARVCTARGCAVTSRVNGVKSPKGRTRLTVRRRSPQQSLRRTDVALELTVLDSEQKRRNLIELDRALGPTIPILSSSVTITVAEQSGWIAAPDRLIGIGALPSFLDGLLVELAPSPRTTQATVTAATTFLTFLNKESVLVQDSVGMVLPRIIGMLANEACFAIHEGVATRTDIDVAMKLGTNYPFGPIEWAERIGVRHVHAVMSALQKFYSEDRYRVAPLLQQAAQLGGFPGSMKQPQHSSVP